MDAMVTLRADPTPYPSFGSVTLGWAFHFEIGIGLALGYAVMAPRIPGPAVVRGTLYGRPIPTHPVMRLQKFLPH